MEEREEAVQYCRLCELSERFDDMMEKINEVAKLKGGLSNDERNLLSVAYKNAISARRASWRMLTSQEVGRDADETSGAGAVSKKVKQQLIDKCEKELEAIGGQILELLDKYLIDSTSNTETKVFYLKMKGDYNRYMAEFQKGEKRTKSKDASLAAYQLATKEADSLPPGNLVKLGLALNFSVFYYEIEDNCKEACEIARQASKAAAEDNKTSSTGSRDRVLIMQLLEDNLNLWTSEQEKQEKPEEAKNS